MTSPDVQTYARALYETLMTKTLEQLRTTARQIQHVNPGAANVKEQIERAIPYGSVSSETYNFLLTLAREEALNQLPEIAEAFAAYAQGRPVTLRGDVTSAIVLNAAQREQITQQLRQHYQAELDLTFTVDETVIGGLIIRIGDQVLDNSLRTRLGAVQRNMLTS